MNRIKDFFRTFLLFELLKGYDADRKIYVRA